MWKERQMHRLIKLISIIFGVLYVFLDNAFAADKLPVFVSIVPQKYFVQQIGKNLVDVQTMVRPGASPATYEPQPKQMADLSTAKIYFAIGVPFENAWLSKIAAANPNMRFVHTDHGIEKLAMEAHHHISYSNRKNEMKVKIILNVKKVLSIMVMKSLRGKPRSVMFLGFNSILS
jgi:ABC-type Zn uptake system ZnuABC Zn-binding protein ZnuA